MTLDMGLQYRQHLTEADLGLLERVTGSLDDLERCFAHPQLARAVFSELDPVSVGGPLLSPSPFLAFCTAVFQTAAQIDRSSFVEERWAARVRIPVFDVAPLREFLASPARRYFLVELLSSYTHVSSGSTWKKTARGWRRRRFSELDPVRLAEVLDATDAAEQPGIYRRLGDLSLFLTGIFPDHTAIYGVTGLRAARLLHRAGLPLDLELEPVALLETLGKRWYQLAAAAVMRSGFPSAALGPAGEMPERFVPARRVLNVVADRFLFPLRDQWFGTR